MQTIQHFLKRSGRKLFWLRCSRHVAKAVLAVMVYWLLYFSSVLLLRGMSLTWTGLLWLPILTVSVLLAALIYETWRWRDPRRVAAFLERRDPDLQLSLRTSLDFMEGRSDVRQEDMEGAYLDQVRERLDNFRVSDPGRQPWFQYAFLAFLAVAVFWAGLGNRVLDRFYNPALHFGQTHLDLNQGSITIFEPDYTQIPGRTLPLKPGTFKAYPGSRVRFIIQLPEGAKSLYIAEGTEENIEPIPVRINDENQATHEFVLM